MRRKFFRQQFQLCFLAVGLGVTAAVVAKTLILGINFFTNFFYFQKFSIHEASPGQNTLGMWAIWVPVVGGVIVGFIARFGSAGIRGHGIPEAMEKILLNDSRIQKRIAVLKPLSSAIAIGSGGPFGAEGPIIATGAALGSMLGRHGSFSGHDRKILLATGAAAGMSAIFGTPLAAVLLAIELLLFEFRALSFIPVALGAATASMLRYLLFSDGPFFEISALPDPRAVEFFIFAASGLIFGLVAVVCTKLVYAVEDLFEKIPIHWMWWPALGGLGVGIIGILEPRSLGVGYANISGALMSQFSVRAALGLLIWKLLSWVIALGSGTSGGTLAPLLTFGALSGFLLSRALDSSFPALGVNSEVFALIGMAAVFAGSSRSLLASLVFALEATRQPLGIVPLLGACSISYLVSHGLMKHSIMTEKIARRGVRVPHEYYPKD